MYKVLLIGGCGYIGSKLIDYLINEKYFTKIIDTQWFGNKIRKNKNIQIIKKNYRDIKSSDFKMVKAVIHLANIANDPSAEIDSKLTWEVNVLYLKKLIELSIKNNVKKFIYASSGSVYGVKKEKRVTEELSLFPISDYNKSKMIAERVLLSYANKIKIYSIRPATVCGYSKNMRLDVSVNMFVEQAFNKKKITLFGGKQVRPNININDLCRVIIFFLKKNIKPGIYNAGFENLSLLNLVKIITKHVPAKVKIVKNIKDIRSYRQDSSKLIKTGFRQKFNVEDAVKELYQNFKKKRIQNDINFYRVKKMKVLKLNN